MHRAGSYCREMSPMWSMAVAISPQHPWCAPWPSDLSGAWGNGNRYKFMMTSSNETFFALLAICAGNSPVPGEFPSQRPVTRNFDVFFALNKRLSKQSWGWWFETPSRLLWRNCNGEIMGVGASWRLIFRLLKMQIRDLSAARLPVVYKPCHVAGFCNHWCDWPF